MRTSLRHGQAAAEPSERAWRSAGGDLGLGRARSARSASGAARPPAPAERASCPVAASDRPRKRPPACPRRRRADPGARARAPCARRARCCSAGTVGRAAAPHVRARVAAGVDADAAADAALLVDRRAEARCAARSRRGAAPCDGGDRAGAGAARAALAGGRRRSAARSRCGLTAARPKSLMARSCSQQQPQQLQR